MFGMNLREWQHFSELRTVEQGHPSYRAMTQKIARQLIGLHPWISTFTEFINFSDPGDRISRAREQSKIAGKGLESGITVNDSFD